jgi:hypothetical protein
MNRPFVLLLLAVPASAWTTSAKASWIDWYDRPNSGYCETAPPGLPLGNYFAQDARLCPENLKRSGNVLRQKPKRTSKPKSGPDARSVDRFLSVRGVMHLLLSGPAASTGVYSVTKIEGLAVIDRRTSTPQGFFPVENLDQSQKSEGTGSNTRTVCANEILALVRHVRFGATHPLG